MYIKNTEQCANFRLGMPATRRSTLNQFRHHIVVLLSSLCVSVPVWAADEPPDAVPLAGTEAGPMTVAKKPVEAIMHVTSTAVASVNSVALAVASVGSAASKTVLDAAGVIQHGVASWYGERFQNKRTANGERFNMNALTAAHPTLPFGTKLCAHSPATGKSVIVRINDRGPFVKDRIIDFSKAAAQALGIVHSRPGVVALLDSSDERCEKG
jgi:rare lipoprotein A (peptidoglycan hydrolase)